MSMLDLAYPCTDPVNKVSVVRNHQNRTFVAFKMLFKPHNGVKIKVVCRLVKDKKIRLFQQKLCKSKPCFFAAGKCIHYLRCVRSTKSHTAEHLLYPYVYAVSVPGFKICVQLRILMADPFKFLALGCKHLS